jgi:Meiotically up-regulated gene 113
MQNDRVFEPTWSCIKQLCPDFAENLRREYNRTGGFVPYEQGYIYLIHAVGSNYYKIGKTKAPDRRLLEIAPQMPFTCKFIRVWHSNFMSLAEKYLHQRFKQFRANGEWFEFSCKQLEEFFNLDLGMDSGIRYAYSVHICDLIPRSEQLLIANNNGERCPRSLLISLYLLYAGSGDRCISYIEGIFREISAELQPELPENLQRTPTHPKT